MVVAGPRHMIADGNRGGTTTTTTTTREPFEDFDMRELRRASSVTTTEMREHYANKGAKSLNTTALKCPPTAYAFVYGTLKRGFSNYWLMEDVVAADHARFLGTARTKQKFPMVCGPYQVPFLIDLPSTGHHVRGELYEVDCHAIERLDELEGVAKGNYVRRSIVLDSDLQLEHHHDSPNSLDQLIAHAYFAAPSYASRLVEAPHLEAFTEKESATYVCRHDRPQHRTFLQHIDHWIRTRELARRTNQCSKLF